MDLKIKIISRQPIKTEGYPVVVGLIKIGSFDESFHIPIGWWSAEDYERQWQEGLKRLKSHDTSCLITSTYDPKITRYLMWWLLYKVDNKVYVQNQMLVADIYNDQIGNREFNAKTCYNFIPPRHINDEDTEYPVSEWVVDYP